MSDTPALDELDRYLAGLSGGPLRPEAVTPDELHAKLVTRVWWTACGEAVAHDPARLVGWYRGAEDAVADVLAGHGDGTGSGEAARAVAAVGVALAARRDRVDADTARGALVHAIGYWSTAGVLAAGTGPDLGAAELRSRLGGPVADLDRLAPPGPARSLVLVAAARMAGATPPPRYRHGVRVLFDTPDEDGAGRTGRLDVAVLAGGPPGLYPDPPTMAFLRADPHFAAALSAAWAYATRGRPPGVCVLWTVNQDGNRVQPINGGSLGAAFAVALTDLLGRRSIGRYSPVRALRAFRGQCAVTGTVTADGRIGAVGGLDGKFDAAQRHRWKRVVAPSANQADVRAAPAGLRVKWAGTVRRARRLAQHWLPVPTALACLAVAAVPTTLGVTGYLHRVTTDRTRAQQDAIVQQKAATVEKLLTRSAQLRTDDPTTALRLGLAATALGESAQTQAALVNTLVAKPPPVVLTSGHGPVRVVSSGPGGLVLTGDDSGTALWDTADPREAHRLGQLSTTPVQTAALSEDGHVAVVAGTAGNQPARGQFDVWDTSRPDQPKMLTTEFTTCAPVALALHAGLGLAGCADGTVTLWRVDAGHVTHLADLTPKSPGVHAVAFNPSGTEALVASDSGAATWRIGPTGTAVRGVDLSGSDPAYAVGYDPNGTEAVIGSRGGLTQIVRLRDIVVPRSRDSLIIAGRTGTIVAAALGADRQTVITGGDGTSAVVWAPNPNGYGHRPRIFLNGHHDTVVAVALSRDGHTAVTGSLDGTAMVWTIPAEDPYQIRGTMPGYGAVVFAGPSSVAVTTADDGTARVWDVTDPAHPRPQSRLAASSSVRAVAAGPGAVVATGTDAGTVSLWDLTDPAHPHDLADVPAGHGPVRALAVDPTGGVIAAGTDDGTVVLFGTADPAHPQPLGSATVGAQAVRALAFDTSGTVLAGGGDAGPTMLWSVRDPAHPRGLGQVPAPVGHLRALVFGPRTATLLRADDAAPAQWDVHDPGRPTPGTVLRGHTDVVDGLAYAADGRMLVTASRDGTAILWSIVDPYQPQQLAVLTGHKGPVRAAAFSPDGGTVISGDGDGIVWDVSRLAGIVANPTQAACRAAGRAFTAQEWAQSPAGPFGYRDPCAG